MSPVLLKSGTINGITAKAYRSGAIVVVSWNGSLANALASGSWVQDIISDLPTPLAYNSLWQVNLSIESGNRYDSRVFNGALNLVARVNLPSGAVLRGTMVYAAAI